MKGAYITLWVIQGKLMRRKSRMQPLIGEGELEKRKKEYSKQNE